MYGVYVDLVGADILSNAGLIQEADDRYAAILLRSRDNSAALVERGWIAVHQGRTADALAFIDQLGKLGENLKCVPPEFDALTGAVLLLDGRAADAVPVLREYVAKTNSVDAYKRLAVAQARAGQLDEAFGTISSGLDAYPGSFVLVLERCYTRRFFQSGDSAVEDCSEAIALAVTQAERDAALVERAMAYYNEAMELTDPQSRKALLAKSLGDFDEIHAPTPYVRGIRAYFPLDDSGASDLAIQELRAAALEEPTNSTLHQWLGHLLVWRASEPKEGAAALISAEAAASSPQDLLGRYEPDLLEALAGWDGGTDATDGGVPWFMQSIRALSAAQASPPDCATATSSAEGAADLQPTADFAFQVLSRVRLTCGDLEGATEAGSAAVQLGGWRATNWTALAGAQMAKGEFPDAVSTSQAAPAGTLPCVAVQLAAAAVGDATVCSDFTRESGGGGPCGALCEAFLYASQVPIDFANLVSGGWIRKLDQNNFQVTSDQTLSSNEVEIPFEAIRSNVTSDVLDHLATAVLASDATDRKKANVMLLAATIWRPLGQSDLEIRWLGTACVLAEGWDFPCEQEGWALLRRRGDDDASQAVQAFNTAIERNRTSPYPPHFLGKAEALALSREPEQALEVLEFASGLPGVNPSEIDRVRALGDC